MDELIKIPTGEIKELKRLLVCVSKEKDEEIRNSFIEDMLRVIERMESRE